MSDYNFFSKLTSINFTVKNLSTKRRIKVFNFPIEPGATRDLMTIPEVSESEIRNSLIKGELANLIRSGLITVVSSSIDLTQYDDQQRAFLSNAGVPSSNLASGSVSASTIANLQAISTNGLANGTQCWVDQTLSPWIWHIGDTTTTDAISVVDSTVTAGLGRWIRNVSFNHPSFIAQTQWHIDYTNGVDTNSGLTSGTSLKTIAEWYRRTGGKYSVNGTTMNLYGTVWPTSDNFNYELRPLSASGDTLQFNIFGQLTSVRTGTITSSTFTSPGSNLAATITDSGVSNWTSDVGRLVIFTTAGSNVWIAKDLTGGAARNSYYSNTNGNFIGKPGVGDTYNVYTQIKIHLNADIVGTGILWVQDCEIVNQLYCFGINSSYFSRCKISGGLNSNSKGAFFLACCFTTTNFFISAPGDYFMGTGLSLVPMGIWGPSGRLSLQEMLYQGSVSVTFPMLMAGFSGGGGEVGDAKISTSFEIGIFDGAAGGLWVSRGSQVNIGGPAGALYGSGNATFGTKMRNRGNMVIVAGITPTLASTGTELDLPSSGTAGKQIPELTPGASVPAEQTCNTWATWAGVNFNRRVMTQREYCTILTE